MSTLATEAEGLDADIRAAVRDLILVLADSKRLLGMRYAQWILGAPELEAGIACASMAQDEWGHARLLYSLLKDFGEDPDRLEHGREPDAYASMAALDTEPGGWAELIALNVLVDGALTTQFQALRTCSYEPIRQRCEKLLEEERFHTAHAAAWARRFAGVGEEAAAVLRGALEAVAPEVLRWFGPEDGAARALVDAGVSDAGPDALRQRLRERLGPLLGELGASGALEAEPSFDAFDVRRRRPQGGAPDAATIARVRGDRNRAFLMD